MKTLSKFFAVAVACALSGCAMQGPFAYVHGQPWFKAQQNTYAVLVLDVDGESTTRNPAVVDPGVRTIRVQGPPAPGFSYGEARTLTLDVQPCMRYYLKAVKPSPVSQTFTPEVDHAVPIPGCQG